MSRQFDNDLSERSRHIVARTIITAPPPTPCDRPRKLPAKQQPANRLAKPGEEDVQKPVSKPHAFKRRQSKPQRLYETARDSLVNSPWLRYQGRQFSPKEIILPNYKLIPALVDWVYHGVPITSVPLLIWLYSKLSELPDSHINQLDTTTVLQLVGPENSHLVRWLGNRTRSPRKTSRHFTVYSDRNVFDELYETDLPTLLTRLTICFEQLALLMRVFRVSQDSRKQLLLGFEKMIDPHLFRIQNRTLLMYAGVNYKQDPIVQLVEEILQNYLYHRGSRPQVEVILQSEELQPSPDQPTSDFIKETLAYVSDCFELVEAVRKRIPIDLEKSSDCQSSHTDLRIWIGSVLVDTFPDADPGSGLNLETPSVLYSQLCDMISSDLKVMILMKKSIGIRIKNFDSDALEHDREAEIQVQLDQQDIGDNEEEEMIPLAPPAKTATAKPNLTPNASSDAAAPKHSPMYNTIQERLAYWKRRMVDAIRAETYLNREYKRQSKPSRGKSLQTPARDGLGPSLPDEENNIQSISDIAGQKRSISEVSTTHRNGKSKLADFPPEEDSDQLSEVSEADEPVSQQAKRLRSTKQDSSESEEEQPPATTQQKTVRHGGLPSSSSSMERDEILMQRRPVSDKPASRSSSSSSSRSHGESSDIIM